MQKDPSLFNDTQKLAPFLWQFNLDDSAFLCEEDLPKFLGFSNQKNLSSAQLFTVFGSKQIVKITKQFREVSDSGQSSTLAVIVQTPESRYLAELSINYLFSDSDDNIVEGKLCFLQHFPSQEQETELLRILFKFANTGLLIADANHNILLANGEFCRNSGYQEHEIIGKHASIFKAGKYSKEFYTQLWEQVDTDNSWKGELLSKNKQGEIYAHDVLFQKVELEGYSTLYVMTSKRLDISLELLREQTFESRARSHIPSKHEFITKLESSHKQLTPDRTIVVAAVNVTTVQKASPNFISWLIAQRFNLSTHGGHLGLLNDNIFVFYWVVSKDINKIDSLLRQVILGLEGSTDPDGVQLRAKIDMGAAILSIDSKIPQKLLAQSVQTLMMNHHQGTLSSLYYFDRRLSKRFDRKETLACLLKESLKTNAIEVYYQPIVELPLMLISKFEALFRITLKTDIEYETSELIAIAEEYDWIDQIDSIVTKIATSALPLIQKHFRSPNIEITINRSLVNDRVSKCCLEDTLNILIDSNIDLSKVTVELTESAFFQDLEKQKLWVNKLQKSGAKIAIDDFGTGYSSLSYLNNLPVNYIKIDRCFIEGVTLESNKYAMIETLCKLSHKMGTKVIAEGIETPEELTLMSRAKVDFLQGFIFSKPVNIETLLQTPHTPYYAKYLNLVYQEETLTARNIMRREYLKMGPNSSLAQAKEFFDRHQCQYIVVIKESRCLGIVYESDFRAALSPFLDSDQEQKKDLLTLEKRVHQIMTTDFKILHANSDLAQIKSEFINNPGKIIIVTGGTEVCLGVLTVHELLKHQ